MIISLIVAMDDRGVIGYQGKLPWRQSADLKHFKELTMGKPIVMGRKTYEAIGRPLPGRENIVITHDKNYRAEGCVVLHSIDDIFVHSRKVEEIVIIGGAELFRQFLGRATLIYMTEVYAQVTGDTFFPPFHAEEWQEVNRQDFKRDDKNEYDYSFV